MPLLDALTKTNDKVNHHFANLPAEVESIKKEIQKINYTLLKDIKSVIEKMTQAIEDGNKSYKEKFNTMINSQDKLNKNQKTIIDMLSVMIAYGKGADLEKSNLLGDTKAALDSVKDKYEKFNKKKLLFNKQE